MDLLLPVVEAMTNQKTQRLDAFAGSIFMGVTAGSRLKTCNTGVDTPALPVLEETCLSLEDTFLRKEGWPALRCGGRGMGGRNE